LEKQDFEDRPRDHPPIAICQSPFQPAGRGKAERVKAEIGKTFK
jgi:hypothetical protein